MMSGIEAGVSLSMVMKGGQASYFRIVYGISGSKPMAHAYSVKSPIKWTRRPPTIARRRLVVTEFAYFVETGH